MILVTNTNTYSINTWIPNTIASHVADLPITSRMRSNVWRYISKRVKRKLFVIHSYS